MAQVGSEVVPGVGGEISEQETQPGGGSGGVAAHPDHWIQSDNSRSGWYYKVLEGDTLWGIAVTYLESGYRWSEIWDYQSPGFKSGKSPDNIRLGSLLEATPDMIAGAAALGVLKEAVAEKRRRAVDVEEGMPVSGWKVGLAVVAAVVGVVAIGGAIVMGRRS